MQQLQHDNTPLRIHDKEISIACNFVTSPANLGSICRNAEAFGVKQILISQANAQNLNSNRFKRTARNAEQHLEIKVVEDLVDEIEKLIEADYSITALEWTKKSLPVQKMIASKKLLIILGNENSGIPEEILSQCHQSVHIHQFGKNSSINVAQALGICLYEITRL